MASNKRLKQWRQQVSNMAVISLDNLPRSYVDDFIRMKKKVKPFELRSPERIGGNLWVQIRLFGKHIEYARLTEFEHSKKEVAIELLIKRMQDDIFEYYADEERNDAQKYVIEDLSARPLRPPSKKGFEKFKLMKGLE